MIIAVIGQDGYPTDMRAIENLAHAIEGIIKDNEDCTFYYGFAEDYSKLCNDIVRGLQKTYACVQRVFVAPYDGFRLQDDFDAVIVPPICQSADIKHSINLRNKWMVEHADGRLCFACWHDGDTILYEHRLVAKGKQIELKVL